MPLVQDDILEALHAWRMTPVLKDGKPTFAGYRLEFAVGPGPFAPVIANATRYAIAN